MNISSINNVNFIKNIAPIKKTMTNPLSFKGTLNQDTVVFSKKGEMPKSIAERMNQDINSFSDLATKADILKDEIAILKSKDKHLETKYKVATEKDKRVSFMDTYETGEAFFANRERLIQAQKEHYEIKRALTAMQPTLDKWETCKQMYAQNDKFAELYQPNLSCKEREKIAHSLPNITSASSLEDYANVTKKVVDSWVSSGMLEARKFGDDERLRLFDLDVEQNQDLISQIRERMQYSLPARQVYENSGFSEKEFNTALKNGGFKVLGYPVAVAPTNIDSALIDMDNELTQRTLRDKKQVSPFPSKKYYRQEGTKHLLVPASYLEKLGYGKVRYLRDMVQRGLFKGEVKVVDTNEGKKISTLVDIGEDVMPEIKMQQLRNQNRRVENAINLSQRFEIPLRTLTEAMQNDEIDIIPEFIFPDDKQQVYIDKARSKNHSYLEKLTIEAAFKQFVRAQYCSMPTLNPLDNKLKTLRMQLIWTMCPSVRKQGKALVEQDKELVKIFQLTGQNSPLSGREKVKLDQFHKDLWNEKTTKEFSNAQLYADKVIHDYEAGGIEAIENPALVQVIEHYYSQV